MKSLLLCLCGSLALTLAFVPSGRAEVTQDDQGRTVLVARDASGRVTHRSVLEADGSRHETRTQYWPTGTAAKRTVEEDRDASGRPTKRTDSRYDASGRVLETTAVTVDPSGKERGTRTRYSYGAQGEAHPTTSRVER